MKFTRFTLSTPSGYFSQDTTLSIQEFKDACQNAKWEKLDFIEIPSITGPTLIDPSRVFFAREQEIEDGLRPTNSL